MSDPVTAAAITAGASLIGTGTSAAGGAKADKAKSQQDQRNYDIYQGRTEQEKAAQDALLKSLATLSNAPTAGASDLDAVRRSMDQAGDLYKQLGSNPYEDKLNNLANQMAAPNGIDTQLQEQANKLLADGGNPFQAAADRAAARLTTRSNALAAMSGAQFSSSGAQRAMPGLADLEANLVSQKANYDLQRTQMGTGLLQNVRQNQAGSLGQLAGIYGQLDNSRLSRIGAQANILNGQQQAGFNLANFANSDFWKRIGASGDVLKTIYGQNNTTGMNPGRPTGGGKG